MINVGIAGWGLAGRSFHAPFLSEPFHIIAVVSSRDVGIAQRLDNFEELITRDDIELIVIATPHFLHTEQAIAAMRAGKHVVVEKPVAASPEEVLKLKEVSAATEMHCIPFQNRRWDGDFLTVKKLIEQYTLGQIYHFESRWNYYRPTIQDRWKSKAENMGGVFYDLAPHLVDQTLQLFGMPQSVYAHIGIRHPDREATDFFRLHLTYDTGMTALLEVDTFNAIEYPRFHIRGRWGTFEKYGVDPQEAMLRNGANPAHIEDWGVEDESLWGQIVGNTANDEKRIRSIHTEPGDYGCFYREVYKTLTEGSPPPVTLDEVYKQLILMDAAQQSSQTASIVYLEEVV
ncbi:MAG: Gfo/Idh/MocA family oxidoreductase [Chloroflexi bacterium]|nr:Gfo/Idh/MocA family oxidoreductase [Chloroflexota bacterium]